MKIQEEKGKKLKDFEFVDLSQPQITSQSRFSGPSGGGTLVRLKVSQLAHGVKKEDLSVTFGVINGRVQTVFPSRSGEDTEVVVKSPEFSLSSGQTTSEQTLTLTEVSSAKYASSTFTFIKDNQPQITALQIPDMRPQFGGSIIKVTINDFPTIRDASQLSVKFGGM